jgi:hypothetical protein
MTTSVGPVTVLNYYQGDTGKLNLFRSTGFHSIKHKHKLQSKDPAGYLAINETPSDIPLYLSSVTARATTPTNSVNRAEDLIQACTLEDGYRDERTTMEK